MKRQHQIEFEQLTDSIIAGSGIKKIICKVTPGGGKSALPIITGKLISHGLVDRAAGPWEDQLAYVFAPDDILMREIVDDIEREQLRAVGASRFKKTILKKSNRKRKASITPIGSAATRQRKAMLKSQAATPGQGRSSC